MTIRYLTQSAAQALDKDLMSESGAFKLEQLMECAGLSCAAALAKVYGPATHSKVLVAAGPGNQGGDGLVAARHLHHFGYKPTIFYPKEGKNDFYQALKRQALNCSIPQTSDFHGALDDCHVVLDAIFGFSFSGEVREPFKDVIDALKKTSKPICSVDIPSAWDVEEGNVHDSFTPAMLISLTAPKLGSRGFKGRHFLGGRFVPPDIQDKYDLRLPPYPDTDQVCEITHLGSL